MLRDDQIPRDTVGIVKAVFPDPDNLQNYKYVVAFESVLPEGKSWYDSSTGDRNGLTKRLV